MISSALACRWLCGFSVMKKRPVFSPRAAARTDRRGEAGDVRIPGDDGGKRLLLFHHAGERNVLCGLGDAGDQAGILLREEAFGDRDIEKHGGADRQQQHAEHKRLVAKHPFKAAVIAD